MNKFCLHGVIKSFDKHPMKRFIFLEYSGPYQPVATSVCPIFVGGACIFDPGKNFEVLKAGDDIFVTGQITNDHVGKTLIPRLIADEISADDPERGGETIR